MKKSASQSIIIIILMTKLPSIYTRLQMHFVDVFVFVVFFSRKYEKKSLEGRDTSVSDNW